MRPSPLVLLALVAAGLALIAVPLARLTRADGARPLHAGGTAPAATAADGPEASGVPTTIRIRFAHTPLRVVLTRDGRPVAEFGPPEPTAGGQMETSGMLRLPADGPLDLLVEAAWPEGTPPTALGVELEPDGQETRRTTVWADGPGLTELLTFSWK